MPGHANLLHGPSSSSAAAARRTGNATVADGRWQVSADKGQAKVVALNFFGEQPGTDQQVDLADCMFSWTRGDPALQQLLSCPFEVPVGRYIGMSIGVNTTFRVLIDDPTNGLFTDATAAGKVATTEPAGGASYVDYVVPGPGGMGDRIDFETYFTTPLDVAEGSTPEVKVVVDMTHTMEINVSGGNAAFRSDFVPVPAFIYGTTGTVAKAVFYSDLGTADNALEAPNFPPNTMRYFYSTASEPAFVWSGVATAGCQNGSQPSNAWNISATAAPVGEHGPVAGGNLGRDSAGALCFALPAGDDWSATMGSLIEMPEATTIGATSVVSCQTSTAIPAPMSGNNYAAGCPMITSQHMATLTLVAN